MSAPLLPCHLHWVRAWRKSMRPDAANPELEQTLRAAHRATPHRLQAMACTCFKAAHALLPQDPATTIRGMVAQPSPAWPGIPLRQDKLRAQLAVTVNIRVDEPYLDLEGIPPISNSPESDPQASFLVLESAHARFLRR